MSDKYKYHEQSRESIQEAQRQSDSKYDRYLEVSVPFFKPKAGENCIRLVPWLNDNDKNFKEYKERWGDKWYITVTLHWQVGPNNCTYLCLDKMKKEPCPICEVWRKEGIDRIAPVDRALAWMVDRNNERTGLQLWAMPLSVSRDISIVSEKKSKGSAGALLQIADWNKGYDIFFDKEGEGKDRTQYKRVQADGESSYLSDSEETQNKWLDMAFEKCLPDLLKTYEAEYLEKVLMGQKDEDPDDRRDERPRRRRPGEDGSGDREETSSRSGRPRDDDRDEGRRRREEPVDEGRERRARRGDDEPNERRSREPDDKTEETGRERVSRRGEEVDRNRETREETRSPRRGEEPPWDEGSGVGTERRERRR